MTFTDLLSSLVSAGALGLVAGGGRELIRLVGYAIEQKTQRERDRLIAANPEAAAALNATPISKPPSVGPLAVLLPLALVTGAAAGPVVAPLALAPRQPIPHSTPASPVSKPCDPPCPSGQRCEGGSCVGQAESPESAAASLGGQRGGFMPLPGWVDRSASPFDRDPALYRQ